MPLSLPPSLRRALRALALSAALAALLPPPAARAHEFWIAPEAFQVQPGQAISAQLLVGDMLEGSEMPYLPPRFRRFEVIAGEARRPVDGRPGARPALQMDAPAEEGLLIVVHETTDTQLLYRDFETFARFTKTKGVPELADRHAARGLDPAEVRERYSRYAKALIAVGAGQGSDRATGLTTEIVALANPYQLEGAELPVQVFLEGAPRADAQVTLFAQGPEGAVSASVHRTDAEGIAHLPVAPGMTYLADAVTIRPLEVTGPQSPAWESLWAALSFAVPR